MRIYFYPLDISSQNSYISRICQAIKKVDESIEIKQFSGRNLKEIIQGRKFWLNWYEDLGKTSRLKIIITFIKRMIYFLLMKVHHGEVFFVLHNRRPHEIVFERLSIYFLKFLLLHSNRIIILSTDSISIINSLTQKDLTFKIYKVLHPIYLCHPKQYPKEQPQFKILFTGLIRPYKNIEILLEIAKMHPEMEFIISGQPCDNSYVMILKKKAKQLPNVFLRMKYNSDEELESLMDEASICVLPYHMESSLNSGVAMYAFSKGMNVIIPAIGTVNELKCKDCVFSYTYTSDSNHIHALNHKITEAYSLYMDDYSEFIRRCEVIRNEVEDRCSIEAISLQVKNTGILD